MSKIIHQTGYRSDTLPGVFIDVSVVDNGGSSFTLFEEQHEMAIFHVDGVSHGNPRSNAIAIANLISGHAEVSDDITPFPWFLSEDNEGLPEITARSPTGDTITIAGIVDAAQDIPWQAILEETHGLVERSPTAKR